MCIRKCEKAAEMRTFLISVKDPFAEEGKGKDAAHRIAPNGVNYCCCDIKGMRSAEKRERSLKKKNEKNERVVLLNL